MTPITDENRIQVDDRYVERIPKEEPVPKVERILKPVTEEGRKRVGDRHVELSPEAEHVSKAEHIPKPVTEEGRKRVDGENAKSAGKPITEEQIMWAEGEYRELIKKIRKYTTADTNLLRDAFDSAMEMHRCSWRKGGKPYIKHPLGVAHFCADMKRDNIVIAAALLHDVVEDEKITIHEITDKFGEEVACLVDAVTNLDSTLEEYETMEKKDLDVLSDVKLIEQISRNPQALYIKVGDRVDNLKDMACMTNDKIVAKVQHTEDVLIPLLRTVHATRLIEILEDLCFKVKNAPYYRMVETGYRKLRETNRLSWEWMKDYLGAVFYGQTNRYRVQDGLLQAVTGRKGHASSCKDRYCARDDKLLPGDGKLPEASCIRTFSFFERFRASIFRDIQEGISNIYKDLPACVNKKNVPLYDIYFVINDECPLSPEDVFFSYYPTLYAGVYIPEKPGFKDVCFMPTIVGKGRDKVTDLPFYLLRDSFGTGYRLFLETASAYLDHINGSIYNWVGGKMPRIKVIDRAEPSASFERIIHVYLRDGKDQAMPAGSTILDLAFRIHKDVGLCAKYAYVNDGERPIPLYTRLMEGDRVIIVTDSDKDNPEKNVIHATIRWFEYVRTREAARTLARYFEKHVGTGRIRTRVNVSGVGPFDMAAGCTVLDLAFLLDVGTGVHFREAYINNSRRPCAADYIPMYDDRVRIVTDEDARPTMEWLRIVRSAEARNALVDYFAAMMSESG